jgi:hypothetical protein
VFNLREPRTEFKYHCRKAQTSEATSAKVLDGRRNASLASETLSSPKIREDGPAQFPNMNENASSTNQTARETRVAIRSERIPHTRIVTDVLQIVEQN